MIGEESERALKKIRTPDGYPKGEDLEDWVKVNWPVYAPPPPPPVKPVVTKPLEQCKVEVPSDYLEKTFPRVLPKSESGDDSETSGVVSTSAAPVKTAHTTEAVADHPRFQFKGMTPEFLREFKGKCDGAYQFGITPLPEFLREFKGKFDDTTNPDSTCTSLAEPEFRRFFNQVDRDYTCAKNHPEPKSADRLRCIADYTFRDIAETGSDYAENLNDNSEKIRENREKALQDDGVTVPDGKFRLEHHPRKLNLRGNPALSKILKIDEKTGELDMSSKEAQEFVQKFLATSEELKNQKGNTGGLSPEVAMDNKDFQKWVEIVARRFCKKNPKGCQ